MWKKLIDNCRKPSGILGGFMIGMMNMGHGDLIRNGLAQCSLAPGQTVLDIGCGGGYAISRMAERAEQVYGVDYSPVSVKKSLAKNKRAVKEGRVHVLLSSVDHMPFQCGMFDLITAFETIYFWRDIRENFRRIHELLKPGGEFFIALEAYIENGEAVNLPSPFRNLEMSLYSIPELENLLACAGFASVSALRERRGHLYVSALKGPEAVGRAAA